LRALKAAPIDPLAVGISTDLNSWINFRQLDVLLSICWGAKRPSWNFRLGNRYPLSAPDKRHFRRHHGHELNIRVQWQAGHVENGFGDVPYIQSWFDNSLAVCLQSSDRPFLGHFRDGIPNVDLATSDVVFAAIQRDAFGKTRNGVFGGGEWRWGDGAHEPKAIHC
jgi:hypothetical protein